MNAGPAPGALVGGRYRIERVLGAGGMASVWLARDQEVTREVAVKVISDALAAEPAFRARFAREARIAATLEHPGLVPVLDHGEDHERPYLVMERVPGGTLADRRYDPPEVVPLAKDLLEALAYVHRAGVVHRDVKPANVLFDDDGRARLADFGIAQDGAGAEITLTGQVLGTMRYVAPEVLAGARATPQSDLYSLGVLLEDCLRPWSPPEAGRLVAALTAREPDGRPPSAAAALALLRPGRPDDGATAPISPRLLVTRRRWRRPAIAAAAVVAVVLAVAVPLAVLGAGGSARPRPAPVATQPATAPLDRQIAGLERSVRALARPNP